MKRSLLLAFLFLLPNFASAALTDSIVGYWKLDESSGNAADSTASANTLTNTNTCTYTTGIINNGVLIASASTQYMQKLQPANIPGSGNTGGDMTINFWIKPTSQPSTNSSVTLVANLNDEDGAYRSWGTQYTNLGDVLKLRFTTSTTGGTAHTVAIDQTLSNATWYMVTYVYTAASHSVTMYVNGSSIGSADTTDTALFNATTHAGLILGINKDYASGALDAEIDEMGIWTRPLSGAEVVSLYNAGAGLQYPFIVATVATSILGLIQSLWIW